MFEVLKLMHKQKKTNMPSAFTRSKLFVHNAGRCIYNISCDHNPSATTAKASLQGTAISLIQHTSCADEGVGHEAVTIRGNATPRAVSLLPHFCTDVADSYHPRKGVFISVSVRKKAAVQCTVLSDSYHPRKSVSESVKQLSSYCSLQLFRML